MNIKDILTEVEYTKERSVRELSEWADLKNKELRAWCRKHSGTKELREIKYATPSRLFDRFTYELVPLACYAKTYYSDVSSVKLKACCGSEAHDGIIINNGVEIFVEIINAIDGHIWALQKELLTEDGYSPWEYNIHGVKGNKTKRKRSISDIKIGNEAIPHPVPICKTKDLVKKAASQKCVKSMKPKLPYGQNETILVITFDDTVVRASACGNDWDDFVDFKRTEIDSLEHNFKSIVLFGWVNKKFVI